MTGLIFYCIIVLFLAILAVVDRAFAMTRVQLKKTMSIMKKQCMPKHGVTESQIGNIEQGVFLEEPDVMCYVACIYKTIQVVKNDRFDKALVMKQVDILYPQEMKAPVKAAIEKCMSVQDGYNNMCEAIFYSAKCLHDTDPPNFVFP